MQVTAEHRPVILVVEDDLTQRSVLFDLFTDEGYEVILASDGEAAIKILTTVRPELVTLDLCLPGVDGSEVLERIRRSVALTLVKVIVLSARGAIPERVHHLAEAVIAKPYETP